MLFAQLLCSRLCANLQGYTDEPNRHGVSFPFNWVFTIKEIENSVSQLDLDIFMMYLYYKSVCKLWFGFTKRNPQTFERDTNDAAELGS